MTGMVDDTPEWQGLKGGSVLDKMIWQKSVAAQKLANKRFSEVAEYAFLTGVGREVRGHG